MDPSTFDFINNAVSLIMTDVQGCQTFRAGVVSSVYLQLVVLSFKKKKHSININEYLVRT